MAGSNVGKLTALAVTKARKRGMYGDGAGLYLAIARGGSKSWILRYKVGGRSRHLGLGPLHAIGLAQARERAADARRLLLDGHDPIEARRASRGAARLDAAKAMTFDQCAEAYIAAHRAGWRNPKHARQWTATLGAYASPVFGALSVQAIDTALVMKVVEPIWATKPETAARLRGRIESVLDWARVRQYRDGENPARWRGHLDHLLPAKTKVHKVRHHATLAYAELAAFMAALRAQDGVAARALEFVVLTAARSGEVLGARWSEIDINEKIWIVPAVRMKGGREHRVPLSDRALAILKDMKTLGRDDFVFPGQRPRRPLGTNTLTVLLRKMGRGDLTVHGFRSSFRDWCAERTSFPSEVAEMSLAHAIGNKVEAAYRRSDLFEKRRRLMDEWARFCDAPAAKAAVIPMRRS